MVTPWNFPVMIPMEYVGPGLATGNAVIVKPPEFTSWALLEMAKVFEEAGALDLIEGFVSFHGADFYGLPRNEGFVTLVREEWSVPSDFGFGDAEVKPLRAGCTVRWRLVAELAGRVRSGLEPLVDDLSLGEDALETAYPAAVRATLHQDSPSSSFATRPLVAVLPESAEQVQAVVRCCAARKVPIVARGSGTGVWR